MEQFKRVILRKSVLVKICWMVILMAAALAFGCAPKTAVVEETAVLTSENEISEQPAEETAVVESKGALNMLDLDGERFRLSDYRGKKIYMKFWASWCTICLASMEELEELSQDTDRDFEVVTVVSPSYGQEMNLEDFRKWFAKQEHHNFRVLIDENGELAQWYGIRGYPTAFFIDPNGAVKVFQGDLRNDMIRKVFASEMMNGETTEGD